MADDTQVVDTTQTQASTTTDTKSGTTDTQQTSQASTQRTAADPNAGKWEAERKGLLADLQKERKQRQTFEQQARDHQTALELERKRVQALSGVTPKSQDDQDEELVRQRLVKMFPALADLTPEEIQELRELKSSAKGLEESQLRQWTSHATRMLDGVVSGVAKEVGGDLSERQKARLQQAYVHEAETNPDFLARHEAGDPKLIDEFVKQFVEDWFEPARRKVTADAVSRQRRVPNAGNRTVPGTGGKKINLSDDNEFGNALVESYKSHGGGFGE